MLKTELKNHILGYTVLLCGVVLFCFTFFWVWPDRFLERVIIGSFAVFYTLWGVLTHRVKNRVFARVVYEYAFVSLIGAVLLLMLTF